MDAFRELLACPSCAGALTIELACRACGSRFDAPDGIPNLRLPADERTETVRRFYERAPFPGYPPRDSLHALRLRAGQNAIAQLLDRAIPGDARIVEIGCGTGQLCLYLARADRIVVGADLTRASLLLGAAAARRFGLHRVQFVETDLNRPGLKTGAFDVMEKPLNQELLLERIHKAFDLFGDWQKVEAERKEMAEKNGPLQAEIRKIQQEIRDAALPFRQQAIDAAIAALFAGPLYGLAVLALLPAAAGLARLFAVT